MAVLYHWLAHCMALYFFRTSLKKSVNNKWAEESIFSIRSKEIPGNSRMLVHLKQVETDRWTLSALCTWKILRKRESSRHMVPLPLSSCWKNGRKGCLTKSIYSVSWKVMALATPTKSIEANIDNRHFFIKIFIKVPCQKLQICTNFLKKCV